MKRLLSVPLVAVVVAASAAVAVAAAPSAVAADTAVGRYVPVAPTRVLDTRSAGPALGQEGTRTIDLSGAVPSSASAVVLNLTATDPSADGYLTVYPTGGQRPVASNLNKLAGETRSNSVTSVLPADGSRTVVIYNQAGSTDVVVDLLGYYDPATLSGTSGSSYYSNDPFRAFDSRDDTGFFGPGDSYELSGPGPTGVSGVTAVAANVTAVDPQIPGEPLGPGYITAWNGNGEQPGVSTVNYGYDAATPNFAIIPATQESDGTVRFAIQNNVSDVDIVVDIVGFYGTPGAAGGTAYRPQTPFRLSDTRQTGVLGPDQSYGIGTAAEGAVALNVNVTAVQPTKQTFLTVYPNGAPRALVSNLNPSAGQVVANAAQVGLGGGGAFQVYNQTGYVNVVADFEGSFVADSVTPAVAKQAVTVPGAWSGTPR